MKNERETKMHGERLQMKSEEILYSGTKYKMNPFTIWMERRRDRIRTLALNSAPHSHWIPVGGRKYVEYVTIDLQRACTSDCEREHTRVCHHTT